MQLAAVAPGISPWAAGSPVMTTVGVGATEPPAGAAAAEAPGTPRFRAGRRPQEFADALVPTV